MTPSSPSPAPLKLSVPGNEVMAALLGPQDELLRIVEQAFPGADIHVRGNEISLVGDGAAEAARVFEELVTIARLGHALEPSGVARAIDMVRADERPSQVLTSEVLRAARGRSVRAKSAGQKRYVDAIRANTITFGVGPDRKSTRLNSSHT